MLNNTWCFLFCNWGFSNEPHIVHILQLLCEASSFRIVGLIKNHTWNIFFFLQLRLNHTWYHFFCSFDFTKKEILVYSILVMVNNHLSNYKKCPYAKDRGSLTATSTHTNIWSDDIWWRGDANLTKTSKRVDKPHLEVCLFFYLDLLYGIVRTFFSSLRSLMFKNITLQKIIHLMKSPMFLRMCITGKSASQCPIFRKILGILENYGIVKNVGLEC